MEVLVTTARPDVGALFDAHAPDLLRYLRRRVGPDAAEDLLHETFVVLLRRDAPADPDRGGDRAWLFGTATNLARHHARSGARAAAAQRQAAGTSAPAAADPVAAVAARVDAASEVRQLAAALRDLDPDDREVLLLVAWAGCTPTEAAHALAIPPGTARSRLHRARTRLRTEAPARDAIEGDA